MSRTFNLLLLVYLPYLTFALLTTEHRVKVQVLEDNFITWSTVTDVNSVYWCMTLENIGNAVSYDASAKACKLGTVVFLDGATEGNVVIAYLEKSVFDGMFKLNSF